MRRPDFTQCYDTGRRLFSRHFLLFAHVRNEEDAVWRVGFAVSKKVGTAVVRNRVKRVLREFFRLHQWEMPHGFDFVVVPKRSLKPELLTLAQTVEELLPVIRRLCAQTGDTKPISPHVA